MIDDMAPELLQTVKTKPTVSKPPWLLSEIFLI